MPQKFTAEYNAVQWNFTSALVYLTNMFTILGSQFISYNDIGGHFSSDPGYQRGQYLSTEDQNMPRSNSFMGSISSMFGRKGGYL